MILTYHEVVPGPTSYVYGIGCRELEEHLSLGLPVTFDDGHESQHRHALPLLQKSGLRATFFVTAGWTNVRPGYMAWNQLAELVAEGHEVQAHGWSHKLFTACTDAELANELRLARVVLEDRLGVEVRSVSLPGGRGDARVWLACAVAGYHHVFTSDPWAKPSSHAGITLSGRFMVRRDMRRGDIERVLAAENAPWNPLRMRDAAKRLARKAVGDRLYLRLWRHWGRSTNRQAIDGEYKGGPV